MDLNRIIKRGLLLGGMVVSSSVAKAETWRLGLAGQVGLGVGGGLALEAKTTSRYDEEKKFAKMISSAGKHLSTEKSMPWDFRIFGGVNFGEEGEEKIGIEFYVGFGRWNKAINFDFFEIIQDIDQDKSEKTDEKRKATAKECREEGDMKDFISLVLDDNANAKINLVRYGLVFGIAAKWMPIYGESWNLFASIGLDARVAISKNVLGIGDKKINEVEDIIESDEDNVAKLKKTKAVVAVLTRHIFSDFDIAPKISLGADFFDKRLSIGVEVRYWMLNQLNITETDLKAVKVGWKDLDLSGSLKSGLDFSINIGVNLLPKK